MKKGAIFDMDGLLFDTEQLYRESWTYMAGKYGQIHNPAFPAAVSGTSGEHMEEVVRAYYPEIDAQAFIQSVVARVEELEKDSVPEKPGMREILAYFHEKGVKMAVASSSRREAIVQNLRAAGIEHYFETVVSGTDVARGKPEPDIFLLAARKLGLAPEDCYVFEDAVNGTRAGIAAGCAVVMIPDAVAPTEDIRAGCVGIFDSLHEALEAAAAGRL